MAVAAAAAVLPAVSAAVAAALAAVVAADAAVRAAGRAGVAAFGNARRNRQMQYNGNANFTLDNSVWDAQTYSLNGQQVAKPAYAASSASVMFGGPLKIPKLLKGNNGMFTINYQLRRSRNGTSQVGTMPTAAERSGDFSQAYRASAGHHLRSPERRALPQQPDSGQPHQLRGPGSGELLSAAQRPRLHAQLLGPHHEFEQLR